MHLLGGHVSIAKGVDMAPARGRETTCNAIQVFTKNQTQWKARPLSEKEILAFRENLAKEGIRAVVAHDSYLINLATPDKDLREKSLHGFLHEMERAHLLGIPFLIFHPGAHVGAGEKAGLSSIAGCINRALERGREWKTRLLLETTAGSGTVLGWRFEQLAEIIARVEEKERVGICYDTAHAFAAGYDIRTEEGYNNTFRDLDRVVGISRLLAFHLNDSKKDLGSRVDRHEHIGKGKIGIEGFRLLMKDPRWEGIPMILETPEAEKHYAMNLEVLRGLFS